MSCRLVVGKFEWFGGGDVKNPSPDKNLLAQCVAPAIHIPRSVSALHELEPNWRFGDVPRWALQAKNGDKGL